MSGLKSSEENSRETGVESRLSKREEVLVYDQMYM